MLKRNKNLQELVKAQKEEEKNKITSSSSTGTSNVKPPIAQSHLQRYNLDGTKKIPISVSITNNNIISAGERNKLNTTVQNNISQKILGVQNNTQIDLSGKSYLKDTGKTYGDYYYDNYAENKDKKIYLNTKDSNYYLNNNGKYEKLGTGVTSNTNTMTTVDLANKKIDNAKKLGYKGSKSSQELNKYISDVSKKTGYSEQELYDIANDYANGKWDRTKTKYENISVKLESAGYQAYDVANKINKLKEKSTQKVSDIITDELFPQEETPWYKKVIKGSEVFKDGYDPGDITKTAVATVGDIGANVTEGFLNTTEGLSDTLQYGVADILDITNHKKAAQSVRNNAKFNSTAAIMGKNERKEDNFAKGWSEKLDKNSISGEFLDTVAQGVGNIGSLAGSAYLSGGGSTATFLNSFASAYGNAKSTAYQKGADDRTATETALVSGLSEAISEQLFDGIPGMKTQGWGEKLVGRVGSVTERYFGTKTGRLVMRILDNSGEGFEEIVSNILNATGNNIIHSIDKKYTYGMENQTGNWFNDIVNSATSNESLEAFISASITSALVNGGNTFLSNKQKNEILKTYAEENNITLEQAKSILNQEIELRTNENATSNLKERVNLENETQNQVLNEMQKNEYKADERVVIPKNDVIAKTKQNSSEKLSKQEIQAIAEEVNNQTEKKLTQTVDMPKENNIKKYTENDINRFSTGNNLIDGVNSDLKSFTEKFYDKETKKAKKKTAPIKSQKMFLGRISDALSNKINSLLNNSGRFNQKYETKDTNIVISSDNIEHIYNHHGNEKMPGQIDVTPENLSKYVEVVSNPDYIGLSSQLSRGNTPTLYFTKKINGYSVAVEVLSTKKQLYPQSYYVFDSNSKEYTNFIKNNKLKKAWDVESGDLKSSDINVQDDTSAAFTNNNDTTKTNKSQIAPSSNNMQQKGKNIPIAKEYQKNTIDEKKLNKDEYIKIANTINESIKGNTIVGSETKERSWIETSLESKAVKDKVLIENLDPDKINYTVKSNKKTLEKANSKIDLMGYDESVKYIKSKLNDNNVSLTDIVIGERVIQETIKKGDTQLASELITNVAILGTELGQKVQALSIIQRLTPEGQLKMFEKIVKRAKLRGEKSFQDVEITPEMVEMILGAYDKNGNFNQDDLNSRVEQFKQKIADQLKTSVEEKIDAWRYLSMLGNPTTHIRNMVSNIAMKGAVGYKNALARTIETIAPIKDRTKTWKKATNDVKDFTKSTAVEMKNIITGDSKYSDKTSIENKKRIFKNNALEAISNFNSNALEFEDWLFSKSAFISTFQEYLTAQGIKTKEDIENNPEIIEKGKNYAVEQSEIATFRQYSKLASEINRLERNSKLGKYPIKATIPFKKTPINVAKTGVSYSPLGLIKNITYDTYQLVKGNIEASQYVDNLSQGLAGTTLSLIGYALAKAGILNGAGSDDKEGKFDSYLGKTGYSIKIGNKYYSLSWLSPVAMPLFVGSNMYEQLEEDKGWDANVVTEALAKTLDPLNEMSFLSGLTNALNSYGKGTDKIKGMIESVAQSYVSQFFPTLFSKIATVADDTKRSTQISSNSSYKFGEQTLRSVMYKIPVIHSKLEPSTDVWGNELKQDDSILVRAFESFIAPYSKKEDITTKMDKELKRVYKKVGDTEIIPGFPQSYITYEKEKYKMSAKEYTQFKKTYGQSANTMLNMLINDSDYKGSADTRKSRMIKKVYEHSRDIAKQEFLKKRKITINSKDFKYNKSDYEDIIDYIVINTKHMEGE